MSTFAGCAMLTALHPELAPYRWPDADRDDQHTDELAEETVATLVASLPATPAELVESDAARQATAAVESPVRGAWFVRALSFGKFVLVGSLSTAVSSLLFLLFGAWTTATIANTIATVLTTVASNQAHARWTFDSQRRGAGMHLRAGLSVALTYPLTTLALFGLERIRPDAGAAVELLVLLGASAVAGLLRYLLLLIGVFPDSPASFDRTTEGPVEETHPGRELDRPAELVGAAGAS